MTTRLVLQRGLTLVEIAIVLVIASILAMVGAPGYSEWIANARIRSTAESLAASLRLAQSAAIRRNERVELVLTDDPVAAGAVTSTPTGRNWIVRTVASTELLDVKTGEEGARGIRIAASRSTVEFGPIGRLAVGALPVTIDLSHTAGPRSLRVLVLPMGSVRLCDPAIVGPDPRNCA